jgi:hypothetical protein
MSKPPPPPFHHAAEPGQFDDPDGGAAQGDAPPPPLPGFGGASLDKAALMMNRMGCVVGVSIGWERGCVRASWVGGWTANFCLLFVFQGLLLLWGCVGEKYGMCACCAG